MRFINWLNSNLKNVIRVFTIVWGVVLIVLMTIANLGLVEEFNWLKWLGNSLILLGIMVFGLYMGESTGDEKAKRNPKGLYQESLSEYSAKRKEVDGVIVYFMQFFQWFLPQQLEEKKLNYLIMNNVSVTKAQNIINYCTIADYNDLCNRVVQKVDDNGNKVLIRQLQEFEKESVYEVLSGKVKLDASVPNYYLTAFGDSNTKSVLEVGKQLDRDISFNRVSNRTIKIASALAISLIWGLTEVKDFVQADNVEAWVNLISRITALFTSFFSGYLSKTVEVKLLAEKIKNKTLVLNIFKNSLDKGQFKPKTEEEIAKDEYDEYLKELEETKNNIIDPINEVKLLEDNTK